MSLACTFGLHDWETEEMRFGKASHVIFGRNTGKVDVKAELQKCSVCNKKRGLLISEHGGEGEESGDLGKIIVKDNKVIVKEGKVTYD